MVNAGGEPLGVNHVVERSVNTVAKLAFFSFILAWILTRAQCQPSTLPFPACSTYTEPACGSGVPKFHACSRVAGELA